MNVELEVRIPDLAALCRSHHVARLALFGSALRNDFDAAKSDIDLLIDFAPLPEHEYADNYFKLADALRDLFGRDVDLVFWSKIENPYFKRGVESSLQLVYAA